MSTFMRFCEQQDLNNPFKHYRYSYNLNSCIMKFRLQQNKNWDEFEMENENLNQYFQNVKKRLLVKSMPFNLYYGDTNEPNSTLLEKFNLLFPFMNELINSCDDKLFYKLMCYFASPTRFLNPISVAPCSLFSNSLFKFREFCKKYETNQCVSQDDKSEWIKLMLEIARISTNECDEYSFCRFKFSIPDTLMCCSKSKVIAIQTKDDEDYYSEKILDQLFFNFPAIFITAFVEDPYNFYFDENLRNACFIFGKDGFMLNFVRTTQIDCRTFALNQIVKEFKYTSQDMIKALVLISLYTQERSEYENISIEAINTAKYKNDSGSNSMNDFYAFLFETRRNTKGPKIGLSIKQKQKLKDRTHNILKDITNIQRLPPPSLQKNNTKQQENTMSEAQTENNKQETTNKESIEN